MKKHLIILSSIVAAASFASCTKEVLPTVEENGMEIGFNAVAQKATKADGALVEGAVFPTDNTFKVWGFRTEAGDFSEFDAQNQASNFMNGLKIEYTTGSDTQRPLAWRNAEHYYYWPSTGKIGFYAFAPSSIAPDTKEYDGFKVAAYTINDDDATRTTDLMFGYAEGQNRGTALPLKFNHALSQILFKVMTDEDYGNDAVFTVKSVTINDVVLNGDFAFNRVNGTWSNNTTESDGFNYEAADSLATNVAKNYGAGTLMIPQSLNATIDIEYTMKNANNETVAGTITKSISKETLNVVAQKAIDAGDPVGNGVYVECAFSETGAERCALADKTVIYVKAVASTETAVAGTNYYEKNGNTVTRGVDTWELGKKYIYTLNFKLNEITFAPTVTNWVEISVDEIELP